MDTGPIDSHSVLGLNSPKENRITFRKKVVCAPLVVGDFARAEKDNEGNQWIRYYLGPHGTSDWTAQYKRQCMHATSEYSLE